MCTFFPPPSSVRSLTIGEAKESEDTASTSTATAKATTMEQQEAIMKEELVMAVDVLTSKACSEEGLEDATILLIQLASVNNATCTTILSLLLDGGRKLGMMVCDLIGKLLEQLTEHNKHAAPESAGEEESSSSEGNSKSPQGVSKASLAAKGVLQDR